MTDWQEIDRYVLDVFRMRHPEYLTREKIAGILGTELWVVRTSTERLLTAEYIYVWAMNAWGTYFRLTDKGLKSGLSTKLEG